MKESIVKQKSYSFALQITKLCERLRSAKHFEISSQLLRSGTSIGANGNDNRQNKTKRLKTQN
jgi:four helix bundle protein